MSTLSNKKCMPCEGIGSPFKDDEIKKYQAYTPEWTVNEGRLERNFSFVDFKEAVAFVNKVAAIAEEENHHPDMLIHKYKEVKIQLYTHKLNGLTENDFIVAAKIDEIQ